MKKQHEIYVINFKETELSKQNYLQENEKEMKLRFCKKPI